MTAQFAGLYGDNLVDTVTGNPLRNTSYTVYQSDGVTPATIYSDRTRTAKANPATTDAYGNAVFYADPGRYVIACQGSTITVPVGADAAETAPGLVTTAGDLIIAGASGYPARFGAPAAAGQTNVADPQAAQKYTGGYPIGIADNADLPTAALAETLRRGTISSITLAALTSAQLFLIAVPLVKGQLVSNITFLSGSTALNTGTNQWFALYSSARALLGVTSDDGATAWAANATKTLALAVAYTVPSSGLYYLGIMVKATVAVPTLAGILVPNTTALNIPPIVGGNSTAALTNPASAPNPAAVITVSANVPYAYAA